MMYNIADIKIQLMTNDTADVLDNKFDTFAVNNGVPYTIIRHELLNELYYDKYEFEEVYKNDNWSIHMNDEYHVYEYISESWIKPSYKVSSFFKPDYSFCTSIFQDITKENYNKLNLHSLTGLGTDQILFSNLLSDRQGFLFHGNGVEINNETYIFTGGSGNGKTTISKMLLDKGGEIFSDDRAIIRKIGNDFYTYGSYIHPGYITKPNHKSIIDKIFFIEHSATNDIELITDKMSKYDLVLKSIVKSFMSEDKLSKLLDLVEDFINIPFYKLKFNLNGDIYNNIKELLWV